MEYYKEKEGKKPIKEPIDLRNCQKVIPHQDITEFKGFGSEKWSWFFQLETAERTYHLIARSKIDRDQWIGKINSLCQNQLNGMLKTLIVINLSVKATVVFYP